MTFRWKTSPWVHALLALGIVLGAVAARELSLGARALEECDEARAHLDFRTAIARAHAAAEARAPFSPYPPRGYARLDAIAKDAESRDDDATAASAYRAMRAAARATRDTDGWLERGSQGMARVGAHAATKDPRVTTPETTGKRIDAELLRDDSPHTLTFVMLGAGALLFFVGASRLLLASAEGWAWRVARGPVAALFTGLVLAALACAQK